MGSQVIASCPCGIEEWISVGGGMFEFNQFCQFPCLCKNCNNIVEINLLTKENRCPKCRSRKVIPYTAPELQDVTGNEEVASWFSIDRFDNQPLILNTGNYKCPRCNNMTLVFSDSGLCWD